MKAAEDYEGGSDSESESDDFEEAELAILHKAIQARNQDVQYSKGSIRWKSNLDKKDVLKKQYSL